MQPPSSEATTKSLGDPSHPTSGPSLITITRDTGLAPEASSSYSSNSHQIHLSSCFPGPPEVRNALPNLPSCSSEQINDILHAYVFGPSAVPSLNTDQQATSGAQSCAPEDIQPTTGAQNSQLSAKAINSYRAQVRRATVSLASPHFNRAQYLNSELDGRYTLPSSSAAFEPNFYRPPPTLDAAHTLLTAWAAAQGLPSNPPASYAHSQSTLSGEASVTSSTGALNPLWTSKDHPLQVQNTHTVSPATVSDKITPAEDGRERLNTQSSTVSPHSSISVPGSSFPLPFKLGAFPSSTPHSTPAHGFNWETSYCQIDGGEPVGSLYPTNVPHGTQLIFTPSLLAQNTQVFPNFVNDSSPATQSSEVGKASSGESQHTSPFEWEGEILGESPSKSFKLTQNSFDGSNHHEFLTAALNLGSIPVKSNNPGVIMPETITVHDHHEARRESDPLPVAPVPQRRWDNRHRYSIANIPCHVSQANAFQNIRANESCSNSSSSSSAHSRQFASFSTVSSQIPSAPHTSTSNFTPEDDRVEIWPEPALKAYEEPLLHFQNQCLNSESHLIDMIAAQQPGYCKPSLESILNSTSSAQTSCLESNLTTVAAALNPSQAPTSRGPPTGSQPTSGLRDSLPQVQHPLSQAGTEIFHPDRDMTFYPYADFHRPVSPFAPPGHVPSAPSFHNLSNQHLSVESFNRECRTDGQHRLPELSSEVAQQQQQTRLRRLSIMTRPLWSEPLRGSLNGTLPSFEHNNTNFNGHLSAPYSRHPGQGELGYQNKVNETLHEEPHVIPAEDRPPTDHFKHSHFDSAPKRMASSIEDGRFLAEPNQRPLNRKYEPTRYGGIGQGESPYPPGLDGTVKPSEEELKGLIDENGERMIPWKQELRCDEDLYTPIWCRGQNDKKEGFCDMCKGGAWFRLKNSAYWYHKQYFHGVSSTTGHYFYPPRETKRGLSTANRQQVLGLCHECEDWVGYSSVLGTQPFKKSTAKGDSSQNGPEGDDKVGENRRISEDDQVDDQAMASKVPTLWYKHAHKCHRHQTCKGAKGRKKAKKN